MKDRHSTSLKNDEYSFKHINCRMEQLSINLQWKFFVRHCAQYAKQGIVTELNCGAVVCWTQSTMAYLNGIFLSSAVSEEVDLHWRLEEIKAFVTIAQPTFPWLLFIEPELLPADIRERSREICLAAQFAHAADVKCMQTTSLLPPVRPLPDAEISFAASQQDVYDALLLNVQAHNIDTSIAENMVENNAFITNFDKQLCCIVSVDGKPVATATTMLLDECLYVALVATSAQHRRVCFMLTLCILQIC
jgi:hypothetical protein